MSYLSLARKYRPNSFADLVGQESVGLALMNAIRLKREPRGVIFTGVRGVGKTTTARIYAKALNCEKGPTPEPCNTCASCLAIQHGTHEDVLEIDGASNTGVDDVRALQETLAYVPQRSTYKVYIIDEVHMLSVSAFNALLKTLEEPPEHVVFIFATTELHKVPETIQSRCQIFHLQKISTQLSKKRIADILIQENISYEDRAIQWIAREGKGSLRDALTLLDQVIAVGGGSVPWEAVEPMVNTGHAEPIYELLTMLLQKNTMGLLAVIARWDQEGLAMTILVEELVKACRNAFILKTIAEKSSELELLDLEEREQEILREVGKNAQGFDLNRIFRTFAKCLDDLRSSELDRFVVENYALEWCLDPGLPDLTSLFQGQMNKTQASPQAQAPTQANPVVVRVAPSASPGAEPSSLAAAPMAPVSSAPQMDLRNRWKQASSQIPSGTSPTAFAATAPISVAAVLPATAVKTEMSSIPSYASGPVRASAHTAPIYATPVIQTVAEAAPEPPLSNAQSVPEAPASVSVPASTEGAKPIAQVPKEGPSSPPPKTTAFSENMKEKTPETMDPQAIAQADQVLAQPVEKPKAPILSRSDIWPATWKDFVDEWKKQKPLQARVLEETYSLEYSPGRIKLAVETESLAGKKLLHAETRKKLLLHFEQLFGFKGLFEVVPKSELSEDADNRPENRETLLERKQKVKAKERDDLKSLLQDHPLTREAILAFDGTIEAIEVQ